MDLNEFLEFHNLTRQRFANMVGARGNSLWLYEAGLLKNRELILRIEIGIDIINDYKLIFPEVWKLSRCGHPFYCEWEIERLMDKFNRYFNAQLRKEL